MTVTSPTDDEGVAVEFAKGYKVCDCIWCQAIREGQEKPVGYFTAHDMAEAYIAGRDKGRQQCSTESRSKPQPTPDQTPPSS